ncbi:MAG: peptidoglycan editing factor PgeF [Candidatus Aminicenantales bacterium]
MRLILLDQIHSDFIHIVEHAPSKRPRGDALVTAVPGLLLAIKTADCLPILIVDARLRIVAAVHAGWKGTHSRIVGKAIETMVLRFGTNPSDLVAALGPCIGPSCYEVGDDVRSKFQDAEFSDDLFLPAGKPGKYFLDLPAANVRLLRDAGVPSDRIESASLCTHCDESLYSWRRDGDPSARLFSFIGIVPE